MSGALGKAGLLSRSTVAHACMCDSGVQKVDRPHSETEDQCQAIALEISRCSVYSQPRPELDADLKQMQRIHCPAGF